MTKNEVETLFVLDDYFKMVESYHPVYTRSDYAEVLKHMYELFIDSQFNLPWRDLDSCVKEFYEDYAKSCEEALEEMAYQSQFDMMEMEMY